MKQWEVFAEDNFGLTESPVWDSKKNGLWWIDIPKHNVYFKKFDEKIKRFPLDDEPGALFLDSNNNVIVPARNQVWQLKNQQWISLAESPYNENHIRFNDGCQNNQDFFVGSYVDKKDSDSASIYLLNQTGSTKLLQSGFVAVNGLGLSTKNQFLYVADTFYRKISRFDYNQQQKELSNQVILWHHQSQLARPDGLWIDDFDNLYFCMFEGGYILQMDSLGNNLKKINTPIYCPTKITLGGQNNDYIFLTSAGTVRPQKELKQFPLSGQVLHIKKLDFINLICEFEAPAI